MAFRITEDDKTPQRALRRIAIEELDAALHLIDVPCPDAAETVRELRKTIKRLRGLLRLTRPHFAAYRIENTALRDAAALLAEHRDDDALLATFDRFAAKLPELPDDTRQNLRAALLPRKALPGDLDAALAAHGQALAEIRGRAEDWRFGGKGFAVVSGGLEQSWTSAQKSMRRALSHPGAPTLHDWRKRIKDHWYHARLLRDIWPEMMIPHIAVADRLARALGEARDTALLLAALPPSADAQALAIYAAEREAELVASAAAGGIRFLAEPAPHLARRWRGWWDAWRV